ncbi:MAG: CDP-alcohol phosphatidyltransferase family protein [Bacteroidetes bacterium]|nr:CDP-alcohol phosphatidyltransferase family protein [Bacteroidota bacterium]
MKEQLKNLPNYITLGNLLCGAIGIERVFQGDMFTAFILVILAAILDFFDGFTARWIGVDGEFGKQLDSLADLVTFGVLPGMILYHYLMQFGYCWPNGFCTSRYAWIVLPAAGAWRLARFNTTNVGDTEFTGVPIPITGIVFASFVLSFENISFLPEGMLHSVYSNFYFLTIAPVIAASLMVSDLRMISLKFKKNDLLNRWKIAFLLMCAAIFAVFLRDSGPVILLVYVLMSVLANFAIKKN